MMTSKKLFAILQELSESAYSETVLLMWLSNCENSILTDVFLLSTEDCHEYTEVSDAPLLVPHPFDKLYLPYMQAQMHHAYGETDKYRNYMQLYNSYRDEYAVHVLSRMDPAYGEAVKKGYYLSAYGIAKAHSYQGTEEDWLKSLIGPAGPEGPRGAAGKSAYELACENGFEGSLQDWLQSLVELLGEHTLTRYAMALTEFAHRSDNRTGIPIYDVLAKNEFAPMLIQRGEDEPEGEAVTVLSKGAIGETIAQAVAKVLPSNKSAHGCDYSPKDDTYSLSGDAFPTVVPGNDSTHEGKTRQIILVPSATNATNAPKLSLNGGDAIEIRLRASENQSDNETSPDATIPVPVGALIKGVPYTLTFCGKYWLVDSMIGGIGGGEDGKDGADGADGKNGEDGKSAYQLAVQNGYRGSEAQWLASLDGTDGYTPVRGEDYFTPEDVAEIVAQASAEAKAAAVEEALSVMRAPTLLPSRTWFDGKASLDRDSITQIHIVDQYTPADPNVESWNADTEDSGAITCYLEGTVVTIAGNGSGRIMANPDSSQMLAAFKAVSLITGLSNLDTRNVVTLKNALRKLPNLRTITGFENWNVRKCESFYMFIAQDPGNVFEGVLDFSRWDGSNAVRVAREDMNKPEDEQANPLTGMVNFCSGAASIAFNKTFDITADLLYLPENLEGEVWMDTATGKTYYDIDGNKMVDDRDGLPNPYFAGRNITFEAVRKEAEVTI